MFECVLIWVLLKFKFEMYIDIDEVNVGLIFIGIIGIFLLYEEVLWIIMFWLNKL